MRRLLLAILLAAIASPALAGKADPRLTAFVGKFVDIQERSCPSGEAIDEKTGGTLEVICMDAVYRVTYEVEKPLEGNLAIGEHVVFLAADHYGFPPFARQSRAMLYLVGEPGEFWQVKYEWHEVYRTNDGGYARCGCSYESRDPEFEDDPDWTRSCRSIAFSPPVTRDLAHASKYVVDQYRGSHDFEVRGERAVCVRGVPAEDVYATVRPDLIEQLKEDD